MSLIAGNGGKPRGIGWRGLSRRSPPSLPPPLITANEIARQAGICPKRYRIWLNRANLGWHHPMERWTVGVGTRRHKDMLKVLYRITHGWHEGQTARSLSD